MTSRRHELDWLRTLAFFVLIFYHIGMYYVADWGWHIKSDVTLLWLQDIMRLTNRWRMSLLFFISGMALASVLPKRSLFKLGVSRTQRLLIPLLVGMFIIVYPQVYIEARSQGLIAPGVINFWLAYINPNTPLLIEHHSAIGLLTWNHLWFLPYLWLYSGIVIALFGSGILQRLQALPAAVILITVFLFYIYARVVLKPEYPPSHALYDDWYNHALYFSVFLSGTLLVKNVGFWQLTKRYRVFLLGLGISAYLFLVADAHKLTQPFIEFYYASVWGKVFYGFINSINHWGWILALIGFANRYLTKTNRFIEYSNQAVMSWYVLHQSLIIMLAWWLKPFALPLAIEFIIITIATICGCALGYECLRRLNETRIKQAL